MLIPWAVSIRGHSSLCISKVLVRGWLKLHLSTLCWSCLRHYELYKLHMQHTCKDVITVGIFPWSVLIFANKNRQQGSFYLQCQQPTFLSGFISLIFVGFGFFLPLPTSAPFCKGWKPTRMKVNRIHHSWKLIPMNCGFPVYWYYLNTPKSSPSS